MIKTIKRNISFIRVMIVAGAVSGALLASFMLQTSTATQKDRKLSKHDRSRLATAKAKGEQTVTLLIAAKHGANQTVVSGIAGLGGNVAFRDDDFSYIRVSVPIKKAEEAARLSGIEAVNLDETFPLEDPRREAENVSTNAAPPTAGTPPDNAYMPTRDIGAPQFMAAHPTFDGRGVKIGILDGGVDILTPELQTAKTLDGEPVRKIADWVTFTDPLTDNDPTWINMQDRVRASGGGFFYNGVAYAAPADGRYRIGLFDERDPRLGGELENDINRDGNPAGSSGVFAVLWDTDGDAVYVDANQNNSFADEPPMTDYKVNYDVGVFGTDNPVTPTRETIPFVVQTDGKNKFVNIGIVSGSHGTHVAGIAAGKDFFQHPADNTNDANFDGAAPEAQIVSIRVVSSGATTSHALMEGMIFAAKHANVDVISMSIGGSTALNDGNDTVSILYDRLTQKYKVQMFISAGNGFPGVNTVAIPSVATKVMSVGAYVHKETWLNNYGTVVAKDDGIFTFSSRGPREDGGFKPNIVASGSALSTIPAWEPNPPFVYSLPPGYDMFDGTSMSCPQAAGGAALLVSAAKQTGTQWKPDQLRQAINSGARYLPGYGAYEQGNGLLQVGAAWEILKTNIKTVEISSEAPVNTVLGDFLLTPDMGPGIYEREGWAPGQSGQRTITFTRTTGSSKAVRYNLTWVGNDGTFGSEDSINLPRDTPVELIVNIGPLTHGVHSAILNLDDPRTAGIEYQVMNTIIAAEQLNASNNYTVTLSGVADRADKRTFFFNVPVNTRAFAVNLTGIVGRVRMLRYDPYGLPFDSLFTPFQTSGTISRTVTNLPAGVYEVVVEASQISNPNPATFNVTASILGPSISPNPDIIASATVGTPVARSYTISNPLGPFTGRTAGSTLGSARRGVFSLANLGQQQYPVVVKPGSTSLRATIGGTSDPAADLDLYVFNCTSGPCVLAGQSTRPDSAESLTIANPAAGNWLVLVDAYAVPAGTTSYDYVDVFTNAVFGSLSVADANALRPSVSSWTVSGSVTVNAAPVSGRVLLGNVRVLTNTNAAVGASDVIIENVSP